MQAWIEKIVVEGFKSYGKERVEIPLGRGFISIVGPNGAGKSNIGDALSFALGIATARTLRAKNLAHLIYSKNSDRAEYAYVEVHFKNYGIFPVEEEDIVISRKVYKDGRSVFRINGTVVRERELSDFLSRAGIYDTAYNVVLQGDIIRFLKMTPVERRKLIEDIAGIGEYEEKKQKALADLGEVELRIRELRLLMDEMEVQMEKLKEEVLRLKKYRELEEKRREIEVKMALRQLQDLEKQELSLDNEEKVKSAELEELEGLLVEKEREFQLVEEELRILREELLPFREKVGRISQSIEHTEKSLQEWLKRLEELQKEVCSAQEHISLLEKEKQRLELEEKNLLEILQEEELSLRSVEEHINLLWNSIKEKEERLKVSLEEMEKTEEKLRELRELIQSKRKELSQKELKLKELELKREKVKEDISRLKEEEESIKASMGENYLRKENYQKMLKEEERSLRLKKSQQEEVETKLRKIRSEREEVLKEIAVIKTRLESLQGESLPFDGIEGVYGKVGQLIKVKDVEYLRAVEVAGGARLSYVVVENEEVARLCIERLKELRLGRYNFIPLSRIKDTKLPPYPRKKGVIDFVVNLVEYDRKVEKAVRFVFGDTLLVESFDVAKDFDGTYRLVTLEGELFEKSGVISGGHWESRGELGREFYEGELSKLLALESRLKEEEEKLEQTLKSIRDELVEKEGVVRILYKKLEEIEEGDKKGFERVNELKDKVQKAEEYLRIIEQEVQKLMEEEKNLKEEIAYLEEKLENLSLKRHSIVAHYKESGIEDLRKEYERAKQQAENLRQSIHTKQLQVKELQKERENIQKEINRKLAFIASSEEEQRAIQEMIEKLKIQKEELERQLESINIQAYELYKKKDRLEEKHKELQIELGKLKIKEEKIKEELHYLSVEKARLQERRREILERLQELEYGGEFYEVKESLNKLREELNRVLKELSHMGGINFKAEEEFREYEERYRDYHQRHERLKEEKQSIKELIEEIDTKKLRAFMETFNKINANLKKVFSELSPGGKAYMVLEREDDPFLGGVSLVVKPRGKEVQYLEAISGGEKTLAALALIFAVQDYKPSPFYYFDEVDAHLDEANARRVGELIKERSKKAQFIVVTLREVLASFADKLIGVSSRGGVSRVFTLKNPSEVFTG